MTVLSNPTESLAELAYLATNSVGSYLGDFVGGPSAGKRGDYARDSSNSTVYICTATNSFVQLVGPIGDLALSTTTPAASAPSDAGTVGTGTTAARADHQHPREKPQILQAGISAATAGINNTETQLVTLGGLVGGTTLAVKSKIRIVAQGTCTASGANVPTFTLYSGTTGAFATDASVAAIALAASPASGASIPFSIEIDATVRTLGASGTLAGSLVLTNQGTTGLSATATQVVAFTSATLATTTATNLDLTFKAAGATTTCTFQDVTIELIP